MDIAGVSTAIGAAQVQLQVSVAVLGKAIDAQETVATDLIDQLANLNVGPSTGKIDLTI